MKRPMTVVGISFLITALGVSFFMAYIIPIIIISIILSVAAFVLLTGEKQIYVLAVLLSVLAASLSSFAYNAAQKDYSYLSGEKTAISGYIENYEYTSSGGYALYVSGKLKDEKSNERITALVYTDREADISLGDSVTLNGNVYSQEKTQYFNAKQYYEDKGIQIVMYSANKNITVTGKSFHIKSWLNRANKKLCSIVDRHIEAPYAGMLKAILLGNDENIENPLKLAAIKSGDIHIFVVSGMHISIIAGILTFVFSALRLNKRLASILTILLVWLCVFVTGGNIPAIRAGIMMTVLLFSGLFHRPADSLSSLFISGMIITAATPYAISSLSFLLSFCATAGVILFSEPFSQAVIVFYRAKSRAFVYIIKLAAMSAAATVGILPVTAVYFGGVSASGIITSVILLPLLPTLVVLGIIFIIVSPQAFMADIVKIPIVFILKVIKHVTEFFAEIKPLYFGLSYEYIPFYLFCAAEVLMAALVFGCRKKAIAVISAVLLCGMLLFIPLWTAVNSRNLRLYTAETNEGNAAIIQNGFCADIVLYGDDAILCSYVERELIKRNIYTVKHLIIATNNLNSVSDERQLISVYKPQYIITGEQSYDFKADKVLFEHDKAEYAFGGSCFKIIGNEKGLAVYIS